MPADEGLPEALNAAISRRDDAVVTLARSPREGWDVLRGARHVEDIDSLAALRTAIRKYGDERAAKARREAVEECAQMLDTLAVYESDNGKADSLPDECAAKIRSLFSSGGGQR